MTNCCDPRPYDAKWQKDIEIPLLIQFSGSTKSSEVFSCRLLYFRIFCAMYCLATMIWSFVRYADRNIAEYWIMYLTVFHSIRLHQRFLPTLPAGPLLTRSLYLSIAQIWGDLMVTFYFLTSAALHSFLSQHIVDNGVKLTNYFHSHSTAQSSLVTISE